MKLRFLTLLLLICSIIINAFSAYASVAYPEDIFLYEDFNDYTDGSIPTPFAVSFSGNAKVYVTSKPDALNKSLCLMSQTDTDIACAEFEFSNTDAYPLSIAFKILVPHNQSFSMPYLVCDEGELALFTLDNGVIKNAVYDTVLTSGIWHSVELLLSSSGKSIDIILDGRLIENSHALSFTNPTSIKFSLSGESKKVYVDDISVTKSSFGGSTRDYYDTPLFLNDTTYHAVNDVVQSGIVMHLNTSRANLCGKIMHLPVAPFEYGGKVYAPLRIISEALGAEVIYRADTNSVLVIFGGKSCIFTPGSANAEINGEMLPLSSDVIFKDGNICVAVEDLASILNRELYREYDFIFIGADTDIYLSSDNTTKNEVKNSAKYSRPTGKRMLSDLIKTHPENSHPRLIGTKEDFDKAALLIASDATAANMYTYIKAQADEMLATSPAEFTIKENIRLGDAVTLIPDRIYTLSMMWRLSGGDEEGKKYAARAWEELESLCSFDNWNEQHFLDTGGLLSAAAIGYDWLYDYLDDTQKLTLRQAIIEKGLKKGFAYMTGTNEPTTAMTNWFSSAYNWNPHCNAGMIMASFAIGDEEDADVEKIIEYCIRSIEYNLSEYEPDGGWQEGVGYWNSTVYDLVLIMSSLESALGTDYGYLNVGGIKETCYFNMYMLGPAGYFNFADSAPLKESAVKSQFYMAKKLNDKNLGYTRKDFIEKNNYECAPAELLWYDPQYCIQNEIQLPKDKYYRKLETVTMRSSWENNAFFAGFHSGKFTNHSHYDTGSYVLDWGGERWAYDTGTDRATYNGTPYSEAYRTRAEGHNTIVIDNSAYPDYKTDTDGYMALMEMDFDDIAEGSVPALDIRENGTGRVSIVSESNGNKSLRIACGSEEEKNQAFVQKIISSPYINNAAKINFKIMREDYNGDINLPEIQASTGAGVIQKFSPLRFGADGYLYYNGEDGYKVIGNYNTNTWYDISVKLDINSQKMSISVFGNEYVTNVNFPSQLSNIYFVRIPVYRKNSACRIDDFSLYVGSGDEKAIIATANTDQQNINAFCKIDKFETSEHTTIAISDITEAYNFWAESAVRGVMLSDDNNAFIVRDEITLKKKADIYWFNHISSDTSVDFDDDRKSVVLTKNGKKMWVGIISNIDASLECVDAAPLASSPNPSGQADNSAYKKLRIKCEGVTSANIEVAFIPLDGDASAPDTIPIASTFEEWK